MWHSIPLTLFWFTYFGSLGIFFPYFSLYLRENANLSGTELGFVLAVSPLIGMVAQPLWGQVADRTGARGRLLAFLTLATALGYGAQWITEWYGYSQGVRAALKLAENERVAGFVYIGTAREKPDERERPSLADIVQPWRP